MGAINAFRCAYLAQPTKRSHYAKIMLQQMAPFDAQRFLRHYVHGESLEAFFSSDAAAFEEGLQLFDGP